MGDWQLRVSVTAAGRPSVWSKRICWQRNQIVLLRGKCRSMQYRNIGNDSHCPTVWTSMDNWMISIPKAILARAESGLWLHIGSWNSSLTKFGHLFCSKLPKHLYILMLWCQCFDAVSSVVVGALHLPRWSTINCCRSWGVPVIISFCHNLLGEDFKRQNAGPQKLQQHCGSSKGWSSSIIDHHHNYNNNKVAQKVRNQSCRLWMIKEKQQTWLKFSSKCRGSWQQHEILFSSSEKIGVRFMLQHGVVGDSKAIMHCSTFSHNYERYIHWSVVALHWIIFIFREACLVHLESLLKLAHLLFYFVLLSLVMTTSSLSEKMLASHHASIYSVNWPSFSSFVACPTTLLPHTYTSLRSSFLVHLFPSSISALPS